MRNSIVLFSVLMLSLSSMAQNPTKQQAKPIVQDTLIESELPLIGVIEDFDGEDDEGGTSHQSITSTMVIQQDVFLKRAGFQLSQAYFKVRGYDNEYNQKYINGVAVNNQVKGLFNYSSIGALNDLTRNGELANYTAPSQFSYGALGGTENLNLRAGNFARGGKATLSLTNRSYYLRGMATVSTGLMPNGWAFTGALGGRYAHEGYVEGTFYKNLAYAFLAEKRWKNASLSFTTFGSPVVRGQQMGSMQEVYNLRNNNLYNSNWGYQNGVKRNSKVVTAFDPTFILSHTWQLSPKVRWDNGLAFHYGFDQRSALNWYEGVDPRPDYYHYLPSYFEDKNLKEEIASQWMEGSSTQINWDNLYLANKFAKEQGNGAAIYMVEGRRNNLYETSFNSTINIEHNRNQSLTAGLGLRHTLAKQYKVVDDLLGAEYVLDIDKFSERDFGGNSTAVDNDITRPNRKVFKYGVFGYDYNLSIYSANIWAVNKYTYTHWDAYYGLKYTYTAFQREGHMQNGRYPDNSLGKGELHEFHDLGIKGGLVYKITGSHFLSTNLSYATEAPLPYNSYISPRITDKTSKLESGRIFSVDVNYVVSLPKLKGRFSVYQTNFYNQMKRSSYYHDSYRTFVNHELKGVNIIHRGLELGLTAKLTNQWSLDFGGTIGQAFYSNNPLGVIHYENGLNAGETEKVYLKNLRLGGRPQTASTLGLRYFINYWFLGANVNYFAQNFVDISPLRRLSSAYKTVNGGDSKEMSVYHQLTQQEEYKSGFTLDLSVGKMLYLKNKKSMNFNLSVNNVLNNRNIRTGGFEQGRIDLKHPERFRSKYFYMQGINCFFNVSYNF